MPPHENAEELTEEVHEAIDNEGSQHTAEHIVQAAQEEAGQIRSEAWQETIVALIRQNSEKQSEILEQMNQNHRDLLSRMAPAEEVVAAIPEPPSGEELAESLEESDAAIPITVTEPEPVEEAHTTVAEKRKRRSVWNRRLSHSRT